MANSWLKSWHKLPFIVILIKANGNEIKLNRCLASRFHRQETCELSQCSIRTYEYLKFEKYLWSR